VQKKQPIQQHNNKHKLMLRLIHHRPQPQMATLIIPVPTSGPFKMALTGKQEKDIQRELHLVVHCLLATTGKFSNFKHTLLQ
jgi:hypothetical protein